MCLCVSLWRYVTDRLADCRRGVEKWRIFLPWSIRNLNLASRSPLWRHITSCTSQLNCLKFVGRHMSRPKRGTYGLGYLLTGWWGELLDVWSPSNSTYNFRRTIWRWGHFEGVAISRSYIFIFQQIALN